MAVFAFTCQMCRHAGGETTASFRVLKSRDERGKPTWWPVDIYSLPHSTTSLKTGFVSLYVFEVLVQVQFPETLRVWINPEAEARFRVHC